MGWKSRPIEISTPTGYTIAALSAVIIASSMIPGVSLGELSTFGLLLVALQALNYAKEQANEWRRREAYSLCQNLANDISSMRGPLHKAITEAKNLQNKKTSQEVFEEIGNTQLDSHNQLLYHTMIAMSTLDLIDLHLKQLGIQTTQRAKEVFRLTNMAYTHVAFFPINQEALSTFEDILQSLNTEITAIEKETGLPFIDTYPKYLQKICMS